MELTDNDCVTCSTGEEDVVRYWQGQAQQAQHKAAATQNEVGPLHTCQTVRWQCDSALSLFFSLHIPVGNIHIKSCSSFAVEGHHRL